jgi:predicted lipoprotein with Yx(FWY)xxD motif
MHAPSLPSAAKRRRARLLALLLPIALVAAVVAGCGGVSYGGGGAAAKSSAPTAKGQATMVMTRHTGLGTILADSRGHTLYLFMKDKHGMSACDGACTSIWPPLTTHAKAHAAGGAQAAKLGTLERADGTTQVTYAGHPLYTYVGDTKAGTTSGQALDQFGAEWYVLAPSGHEVDRG